VAKSTLRLSALSLVLTSPVLLIGCSGSETIPLKKMDYQLELPAPKKAEDQPKHLRPPKGSSYGMTRDPSGMSGGPPPSGPP